MQCPFCHQNNACAVDTARECWCQRQLIPAELIQLVTTGPTAQQCICAHCVALFNQNPVLFKARFAYSASSAQC